MRVILCRGGPVEWRLAEVALTAVPEEVAETEVQAKRVVQESIEDSCLLKL